MQSDSEARELLEFLDSKLKPSAQQAPQPMLTDPRLDTSVNVAPSARIVSGPEPPRPPSQHGSMDANDAPPVKMQRVGENSGMALDEGANTGNVQHV